MTARYIVRRWAMATTAGLFCMWCLSGFGGGHEAVGQSTESTQLQERLDQVCQQYQLPGIAAALITTEWIDSAVSGVRKLGDPTPLAQEDLWHLGSNMKAMSAMLIAMLVENGQLYWDSTIAEVLPELAATMLPAYRQVTLEQLLAHRGGVLPFTELSEFVQLPPELKQLLLSRQVTVAEKRFAFTTWLLQQPSPVVPGQDYLYSNAGYVVAATMVERVTGQSFTALLRHRLLSPLGLHGKFNWPAAGDPNQPWGHEVVNGQLQPDEPAGNRLLAWLTPAGNISLSVDEYARFIQAQLRGLRDQPILISESSYQKLHTPVGRPIYEDSFQQYYQYYALGWSILLYGTAQFSLHEGSVGTFDAWTIIQPDQNRAVIVLSNVYSDEISGNLMKTAFELLDSISEESR